jgi:hypothetical protein
MLPTAIDGLAIYERVVRSSGHRMYVVGVCVIEVPVRARTSVKVVEVSIVYIDAAIITPPAAVPRMEGFTPT